MKRSIALVVRPPADGRKMAALRSAVDALRGRGHRVRVRLTFEAGDARRYARSAARCGWDVVVAAGGDGTINEVVNGLAAAGGTAALAVLPLGTANDFARGLGIPPAMDAALRVAAEGARECMDVARVNRRCFINVSTGGFGAAATRSADPGFKRYLGPLAYLVRGARQLVAYEAVPAAFEVDGRIVHDGPFAFFAVGNARQTGGGTRITPRADTADGMMDVVIVGDVSRLDLLSLLPDLRLGTHLESPHVHYYRAQRMRVTPAGRIAVNADGELVAGRGYAYDMLPRGQSVMVPPEARPGRPVRSGPVGLFGMKRV
jgi:lipid kinase YegS